MHHSAIHTEAARHTLGGLDPIMAGLIAMHPPCDVIAKVREPFEALTSAIVHQQLSGKAAQTILGRVLNLEPEHAFISPETIVTASDETLRACGLSRAKTLAVKDLAERAIDGRLPSYAETVLLEDGVLIDRLTAVRGVGVWTVQMYLIFTLARPDVFPSNDMGVRNGYAIAYQTERPSPKALEAVAEQWAPYRSLATWYLYRAADTNAP